MTPLGTLRLPQPPLQGRPSCHKDLLKDHLTSLLIRLVKAFLDDFSAKGESRICPEIEVFVDCYSSLTVTTIKSVT